MTAARFWVQSALSTTYSTCTIKENDVKPLPASQWHTSEFTACSLLNPVRLHANMSLCLCSAGEQEGEEGLRVWSMKSPALNVSTGTNTWRRRCCRLVLLFVSRELNFSPPFWVVNFIFLSCQQTMHATLNTSIETFHGPTPHWHQQLFFLFKHFLKQCSWVYVRMVVCYPVLPYIATWC